MNATTAVLPISGASIGFDPETSRTNCLRFIARFDDQGFSPPIVRGEENVRATLASIGARNVDDVNRAFAVVEVRNCAVDLVRIERPSPAR